MKKFSAYWIIFNCLLISSELFLIPNWASQSHINYDDVYALEIDWPIVGNIFIEGISGNQIEFKTTSLVQDTVDSTVSKYLIINKIDDVVHMSLAENHQLNRLDLKIRTPSDLSIIIKSIEGNISLNQLRGNVNIQTQKGDVELQKTTGRYKINVAEGKIKGQILLNGGENIFSTQLGNIDLKVLDQETAGLNLNAPNGNIILDLPDDFLANFEIWQGEKKSIFSSNQSQNNDCLVSLKTGENGKIKLSHKPIMTQKIKNSEVRKQPDYQPWKPQLKFSPSPIVDFNRVDGWTLGGNTTIQNRNTPWRKYWLSLTLSMTRLFGGGKNDRPLYYQIGAKQTWRWNKDKPPSITAGLLVYRVADVISNVGQYNFQDFLHADILGVAGLDYYERLGGQVWLKQQFSPICFLELILTDEIHGNLNKYTDWSLVNKFQPKRGNQRIQTIDLQSAILTLSVDTRNDKRTYTRFFRDRSLPSQKPTTGWLGCATVEKAHQSTVDNLGFTKLNIQLTRYNRIGENQALNLRCQAGLLHKADYLPQRLFYLGGTSLRGFEPRRFIGNRLLSYNIEYVYLHPRGVMSYVFSDGGYVWYKKDPQLPQYGVSLGLGFGIYNWMEEGQIRFEISLPFTGHDNVKTGLNSPQLAIRIDQSF